MCEAIKDIDENVCRYQEMIKKMTKQIFQSKTPRNENFND